MDFNTKLNEYIKTLNCTAKDLSEYSGLSAATISRYRSVSRIPESGSQNFSNLVKGIVKIAEEKAITGITMESVADDLLPFIKTSDIDMDKFQANLNLLLNTLSVNISELSKVLNYDASYISRIRNGKRQPADPQEFACGISAFIAHHYQKPEQKEVVANLIHCSTDDLADSIQFQKVLSQWLTHEAPALKNQMMDFLEKIDSFDLEEYIRVIRFDKLKVPSFPFQLPTFKNYWGLSEMKNSELDFLRATVLSKSGEPVIMYSDMPLTEMAKDTEFAKKWMFGMAMMLKKGLHLNQIHDLNRTFEDMMLGLESWIPMYMTGQISPYYFKQPQNSPFSHLLKVSGSAALTGEAIRGYHNEGKYYLTKNKEEIAHYQKYAERLLSKASPLMEIYRKEHSRIFHHFLESTSETPGNRYRILSSFSLYTASEPFIRQLLKHNQISDKEQTQILQYAAAQRETASKILSHSRITEEIPLLKREEFEKHPITLSLSGMFYEKDIFYTWEDYQEHLQLMRQYSKAHPQYTMIEDPSSAFRNIQIYILEGKWVLVSKNKTPAIHFLIQHPKMQTAFENMIIPIIEDERPIH